jgi:DNA-binding response OmpR family regulator
MSSLSPSIRKVLLIDDDKDDCIFFEDALKELDPSIHVRFISSTKEVNTGAGCQPPDLLFLDINMPDKNGFEWLKEIREKGYTFPVIMYSTASNPAYVQRAYEEGANVYFPKPESLRTLQDSLKQLLRFNWNDPHKITECFYSNGQYRVFEATGK